MRRFSPRLFALGAVATATVLAANVYASTGTATRRGDSKPTISSQTPDQVVKTHADYLVRLKAPRHASVAAAAAQAAHDVLVRLYPSQTSILDADLATSLASVPDGQAKDLGVRVGATAAAQILSLRSNDGSAASPIPFTPGTNPGDYRLTPPAFAQPVFTHWGAPIQNYWNEIAQTAALQHDTTLPQNARLFALLDLTLADSVIAFYDAKYTYHFWRPVTAIRAEGASPADVEWTPLANTALDPSYPGAHAVVSAAGADVLASFFHNVHDSFAVTSEVLPGVERSFTSFSAAADEASVSRIYAGQHFRFDQVAGQRLGPRVAHYVLQNFLTSRAPGYR